MPIATLLADVGTVDIGTGAGWAGAGILTGVLGWLLFVHLPAKDKQVKDSQDLLRQVYTECQARIDKKSDDYASREAVRDDKFLAALEKLTDQIRTIGQGVVSVCQYGMRQSFDAGAEKAAKADGSREKR